MQVRRPILSLFRFLIAFLVSLGVLHSASFSLDVVGSFGGGAPKDVVVAGDYAYVATEAGLLTVDISDPSHPKWVSTHVAEYGAHRVAVEGDLACIGSWILRIVDISRPEAPVEMGNMFVGDVTYDIALSGDHAYVATSYAGPGSMTHGILVVDLSDPASPRQAALMRMERETMGVAVVDGRAYVPVYGIGLRIMDVSDPEQPLELGLYAGAEEAQGVAVAGYHAYVADGAAGLRVIDIRDPATPSEIGRCEDIGTASRVRLSGQYAYVWAYYDSPGFKIIDISDPTHPFEAGRVDVWTNGMFVSGRHAYVGHYLLGLKVIDVSDPSATTEVGEYRTSGHAVAVRVVGDRGYLLDSYFDMTVLDISDPRAPSYLGSCHTHSYATDLYVAGDYVYVTENHNGLSVIDVTDPHAPAVVGHLPLSMNPRDVWASGEYAYVCGWENAFRIIDVSDPASPTEVGSWTSYDSVTDLAIRGDYAYLAVGSNLTILNIGNPSSLGITASSPTPSSATAVSLVGNFAYVGDYSNGLSIFDVSDVHSPLKLSSCRIRGGVDDVCVFGTHAYAASYWQGVRVMDVSDPEAPLEVDGYRAPGRAKRVFADGGYVYLASQGAGLLILKFDQAKYRISGYVRDASGCPLTGVEVTISGDGQAVSTTTGTGYFAFSELEPGDYVVTPSMPGWHFSPQARYYDGLEADVRDQDFVAEIPGFIKVVGGSRGYIEPAMGEVAKIEILGSLSGTVNVAIYALDGELVWEKSAGISCGVESSVIWDCLDRGGDRVASGVYLLRVTGCGIEELRKVVVVR